MMGVPTDVSEFFVAGGTLPLDVPSYVKRPADDELLLLVSAGEFCYVLTPRQMGKSSLMVRTARRLEEQGARTAIIDLTGIGTDVSAEQWYLGLITRLKSQLRLSVDPEAWWTERASLGVVQRFTDFLHDVVLAEIEGPVVILVDEIDTTLRLGFSDDFFAAIRSIYNARASDPVYGRSTFVLLGVAAPADLIKDPGRTPFNIGHRIDLHEFSREDAWVLQQGLEVAHPAQGKAIFDRIFYWTSGHPYLTQRLCKTVAEAADGRWADEQVDALVEQLFLLEKAPKETNLQFVRDRIKILTYLQRRQLLELYHEIYRGRRIDDDERSLIQNQLKLLGLVKVEDGYLYIRNEIYRHVFDLAWVRENTPTNWAPIVTGVAVSMALLMFGAILYNAWVGIQFQDCYASFYQTRAPEERLAHLARIFRLQGLFGPTDYDYRARELFYGLSREEQLALFDVYDGEDSDLLVVVRGLYVTLADIDGTDSTGVLLEAMARALERTNGRKEAVDLRKEIDNWQKGRELVRQNLYPEALEAYNRAVALNDENPATLYERARVLIDLLQYEQALNDLDRVMAIARRAPVPTPTPPALTIPIAGTSPTHVSIPGINISSIQTPAPNVDTSPIRTPFPAAATTPTLSPDFTEAPTSTLTSELSPTISEFATFGQVVRAVKNLIYANPDLVNVLVHASSSEYANLQESGLVVTPASTETAEPTPTISSDITIERYVRVTGTGGYGLNLRSGPGEDYVRMDIALEGETFLVVDGPTVSGGSEWWKIRDPENEQREWWTTGNYLETLLTPRPGTLCNNGFENIWACWSHGGELSQTITSINPHSGAFSALLGDPKYRCERGVPVGSAWMEQTVLVPSTASPELVFWYNIFTQDRNRYLVNTYDSFDVKINGLRVFRDMNMTGTYGCNSPTIDLYWRQRIIALSSYAGASITIRFENRNNSNGWYNTWTYVDDVQVAP